MTFYSSQPTANGKRSKKAAFGDPNNFTLVGIELFNNIDLKSDGPVTDGDRSCSAKETHARKMSLKFIFVTPRQLIEKEGREQKAARVNVYIKIGETYEMLGHKEDFRYFLCYLKCTRRIVPTF
jgi:hypothetical protein